MGLKWNGLSQEWACYIDKMCNGSMGTEEQPQFILTATVIRATERIGGALGKRQKVDILHALRLLRLLFCARIQYTYIP